MGKPKAIYLPGKAGDACLQWPVADQWLRDHKEQAEVWLDPTCKVLQNLFLYQPTVSDVKVVAQAKNYSCGGQPWQGEFTTEEHSQYEILSLGFRAMPQRQITLQTAMDAPLMVETRRLATEPAFVVPEHPKANRVVVHGTFRSHLTGCPTFWKFFHDVREDLEREFDEIIFTGTHGERSRALDLYPAGPDSKYGDFADDGDFLKLAALMGASRLVIGSGSSGCALGAALKVPTFRIHDPINDFSKSIWSGLGERQWNETFIEARKAWPRALAELPAYETVAGAVMEA